MTEPPVVPLVDLGPQHEAVRSSIYGDLVALAHSGRFTSGAAVERFEHAWAAYCQTPHAVGVGSGTSALALALRAVGVRFGDRVIVPAHTFIATWEAVEQLGGIPLPFDVDPATGLLALARSLGSAAATAVVPVHLYGRRLNLELLRLNVGDCPIVEDACQAHGAVGPGGSDAACFSFFPSKNLGAWGDAGAVVTADPGLAASVRSLREHGWDGVDHYHHVRVGTTSRLDTLQAAVLLRKLPLLDEWNRQRRAAASYYNDALAELDVSGGPLARPPAAADGGHVWHLYVVRVDDPPSLQRFLAGRGIGSRRHYPVAPHLAPAFRHLGYARGDFPAAEAWARECLSLPIFPGITLEQQEHVVRAVREYCQA